ncbi:MAG: hypothetical protein NTW21_08360 [Verrucomicrobia bacterium]|nr:hypothetical protein [Verrucomicrobiota bacterium]
MRLLRLVWLWMAMGLAAFADSVTLTKVVQSPWIIDDAGVLKSETTLTIENKQSRPFDAWVKISVPGKVDYIEALGSLVAGENAKVVYVAELNKDGDDVTFTLFDNSAGTGA